MRRPLVLLVLGAMLAPVDSVRADDGADVSGSLDIRQVSLAFHPVAPIGIPAAPNIGVGNTIRLGLFAFGEPDGTTISAAQVVFSWDPQYLHLVGLDGTDGAALISSGFPISGSGGLNESAPPQDGDGFYIALAQPGTPIVVSDQGTLLTTFLFEALEVTPSTDVEILPSGGTPEQVTKVLDGAIPNFDVTGALTGVTIRVAECVGDIDLDGDTDVFDFGIFATNFGMGGFTAFSSGDIDGDGDVDVFDFALFAPDFGCGS